MYKNFSLDLLPKSAGVSLIFLTVDASGSPIPKHPKGM